MNVRETEQCSLEVVNSPLRSAEKSRLNKITHNLFFQLFAAFVVLALIQGFVVKLYNVPSGSMEQTLQVGDRIVVNRLPAEAPKTGDVIVFRASTLWEPAGVDNRSWASTALRWVGGLVGIGPSLDHVLVKRVIAGPGQTVSCCGERGQVLVDGKPLSEPYIFEDFTYAAGTNDCDTAPASRRCFAAITVPKGQYFVLGDHRSDSDDSIEACRRLDAPSGCLKMVGAADVVGQPLAIVFPFTRWGGLAHARN